MKLCSGDDWDVVQCGGDCDRRDSRVGQTQFQAVSRKRTIRQDGVERANGLFRLASNLDEFERILRAGIETTADCGARDDAGQIGGEFAQAATDLEHDRPLGAGKDGGAKTGFGDAR